jgi:hypothetical protein
MATTAAADQSRTDKDPRRILSRLFETDFTQALPFAVLGAVFLLLRAPFLNYGHGTDPDAWRVAITAHHLLDEGKYFPSRLPGNPLHELVTTAFIWGGWIATNLTTALVSLLGVYLFARIVKLHRLAQPGLLVIGFAFTPLLFINSITTMDYMWALTGVLASYHANLQRRPILAGICIGLAIGFRLQAAVSLPALMFLLWRQGDRRDVVPFLLAAGGIAALAFAPVLATYGTHFMNVYDAAVGYRDVLRLLAKEALGVIGALAVVVGVVLSWKRLHALPRDALRDPVVGTWVVMIGLYALAFLRLPHEVAYLIPLFPFGLLLIGRYFVRSALILSIACILLAGVVDITTRDDGISLSALRTASIGRGLIFSNAQTMSNQHDFVDEVLTSSVPDHSVVMAGFVFPQLAVRKHGDFELGILERDYEAISMLSDRGVAWDKERDIRYVWLLTYEAFESLRSQGYSMFLVPDAAGGTSALYDYRPSLLGATFLRLEQTAPSTGKGTASTDR